MSSADLPKYPYFKSLKEEKRRNVEIKNTIKSYDELKKVIKMAKNMTKNREIAEIRFDLSIDFYLE